MSTQIQVEVFLKSLLDFGQDETDTTQIEDLGFKIWKILTREHRLASRPDPDFKTQIIKKINDSISANKPILLINGCGGFKNYASPTAPHADWSEVFMLHFLAKQCAQIAAIYAPGVRLEFSGDSYILPLFDNLFPSDIDTYTSEFGQLLEIFQKHLPKNVVLGQKNMNEFYDVAELSKRLTEMADEVGLDSPKSREWFEQFKDKAANNFNPNGVEDLSKATPEQMEKELRRSVILDRLWITTDVEERAEYLEGGLTIPLSQTPFPGCIGLKSVSTSKLAFWLGSGYLRRVNDRLLPCIQHCQRWSELRDLKMFDVDTPFASLPSLSSIPYLAE